MNFRIVVLCIAFSFVCVLDWSGQVSAQANDQFEITTLVGNDTPPTIPGNFSVTPVTTTQIDLDWDASSDNLGVSGYQVYRDGSAIATTTLTNYSDTGLTASTTYSYFVEAFDTNFNYSTSTATLATTTPQEPPDPVDPVEPEGGESGFYLSEIVIDNLEIEPSVNEVTIRFTTNLVVQTETRWGRTLSYEQGYIIAEAYRRVHQITITGLEAGAEYQTGIVLRDRFGRSIDLAESFTTVSLPDQDAPTNVSNLVATMTDEGVRLRWDNPAIADFAKVRVVSNDAYYPIHIADGWLVYDGGAEQTLDQRSLPASGVRFYSVYVFDVDGNISSGAIAWIKVLADSDVIDSVVTDVSPSEAVTSEPGTQPIDFSQVQFVQDEEAVTASESTVTLSGHKETLIRIPYELFPERLKSIVMSFEHPTEPDKAFSFLLKINKDKSYYEARIAPFAFSGDMKVTVSVFDYALQEVSQTDGMVSLEYSVVQVSSRLTELVYRARYIAPIGISLLFLLWLLLWRRRAEVEDNAL